MEGYELAWVRLYRHGMKLLFIFFNSLPPSLLSAAYRGVAMSSQPTNSGKVNWLKGRS